MTFQGARSAHQVITNMVGLILLAAVVYAGAFDGLAVTLSASAVVAVVLVALRCLVLPRRVHSAVLAALGMVTVGVLIHAARGRSESHFAVFVFLAVLLIYRDWLPLAVAAATVTLHHLLFNFLQQWQWGPICFVEPSLGAVLEHTVYVVAETAVLVVLAARASGELAELRLLNSTTKRTLARIRQTTRALGESARSISGPGEAPAPAPSAGSREGAAAMSERGKGDEDAAQLGREGQTRRAAVVQLAQATLDLGAIAAERDQIVRRHTDELRRVRDEAVAANHAKSAFLANMSHEIRTPLTSIIGFAELLLQPGTRPVDPRASLETIIRNGRHLLEVINDILDLAKIETQRVELERIEVPLPELLRDLTALVSGRAQERSLEFTVVPNLPLPSSLCTDPVRLKQILLNFCSNAIKFTQRGGVTLELRYFPERPSLRFTVVDTGIGMTPPQMEKLFKPFVQADVSTTREFGGTGLGLYISRQLATLLNGTIDVESEPGRGSRFHLELTLPAAVPPQQLLTLEGDLIDYERPAFAITSITIPELAGRVLLAEDGRDNQRLISAYLQQAGLSVTVVSNGREAVEAALAQDFDLLLMDVQMPVMDGMSATRMLRTAGYRRPIVALTANVMQEDIQRYRAAGCDHVLAKPIDRDAFYEVVSRHLAMNVQSMDEAMEAAMQREMAELRREFQAGLPAQADAIRTALRAKDWPSLTTLTHTLKGTAGSFGHGRLTELAGTVEGDLRAARHARAALQCEGLLLEMAHTVRHIH